MSRGRNSSAAADAILDLIQTGAEVHIEEQINRAAASVKDTLLNELHEIEERIAEKKTITIKTERGTKQVTGMTHKSFPSLLSAFAVGFPVMMVGPAGSGKTMAAEQLSESVGLPFYAMSVGAQTSKSDLIGYMSATGSYVETTFRKAYEHGGVFLLDEIDAGNANVLIILNAALSGNMCAFPDKMVKRHKDFFFVATANTFGTGADRQYVGRNQIDAATLDRFIVLEWDIDEALERMMVETDPQGERWHKVVLLVRQHVAEKGYRLVISPRATLKGSGLLNHFDFKNVVESVLLAGATKDQRKELMEVAVTGWQGNPKPSPATAKAKTSVDAIWGDEPW